MLTQIAMLYGTSWLAAALIGAALEWMQLTRSRPLTGGMGFAKTAAIGWAALPFAALVALVLPLIRRLQRLTPV